MAHRTWLITGVSSGFGRHLAEQLLARGDIVIGTIRNPAKVSDLVERYPRAFHAEMLDVTDRAAVRRGPSAGGVVPAVCRLPPLLSEQASALRSSFLLVDEMKDGSAVTWMEKVTDEQYAREEK